MFLALTVSSIAHEIYYLDNRYLVRYSFSYILHFPKTTATAKKGNLRTPIKFSNFNASKNIYVCHHIDLYREKPQNIRNRKNQLLLATISPHKNRLYSDYI